ncbi:hypothetical protein ACFLYK_02060 [Candidatus Cloacimonadota bacterium]
MDSNKYTRNVIILMIGIASIILGMLFANLAHQITEKNKHNTPENIEEVSQTEEVEENRVETSEPELYETCVLISTDKDIVLNNSYLLEQHGYPVKIAESQRANKLIFSLIVDKQIPKEDAILLGEEIKAKFQDIRSYWIEEVMDETENEQEIDGYVETETFPTGSEGTEPIVKDTEYETPLPKDEGVRYEIQLMANTDLDKINTTKQFLEEEGYRLKIIDFEKDGITYHRLRLANAYSLEDANTIGEELKQNFKFVNSYWLDKIIK